MQGQEQAGRKSTETTFTRQNPYLSNTILLQTIGLRIKINKQTPRCKRNKDFCLLVQITLVHTSVADTLMLKHTI